VTTAQSDMASDQFLWPAQPLPPTVGGFIEQMSSLAAVGQALDFTMDYVAQLCLTEPGNCALLLDTLDGRMQDMQDKILGLGEGSEVSVYSDEHYNNNSDHVNNDINRKEEDLLGLPRHTLMLALLPFFPVMLLFTASGGLAFFVTAGIEFIARLVYMYNC
jgi:hypothetical protein